MNNIKWKYIISIIISVFIGTFMMNILENINLNVWIRRGIGIICAIIIELFLYYLWIKKAEIK